MPSTVGIVASHVSIGAAPPPFVPTDLAGLETWYDSSDAATFTFSSSTVVSQWRDKSAAARHLAQGTVANQPNRNGVQNALPTVVFSRFAHHYLDTAAFTLAQPMTVFVARNADTSLPVSGFGSVGANLQLEFGDSTAWSYYAGTAVINGWASGHIGAHVIAYLLNGASTTVFKDGAAGVGGNPGTSGTTTGFRVGAERNLAVYWEGSFIEIITYSRILNGTERAQVETYLKTKWATP